MYMNLKIPIAIKVFFGFLVVVFLNIFYVVLVYQLSDLNDISQIQRKQAEIQLDFLRISQTHKERAQYYIFYSFFQRDISANNILTKSSDISKKLDSLTWELGSLSKRDSVVSQSGAYNPHLLELIEKVSTEVKKYNRNYTQGFKNLAELNEKPATAQNKKSIKITEEFIEESENKFVATIEEVNQMLDELTQNRLQDIENRFDKAKQAIILILFVLSSFAMIFAFVFSRYITNSLRKLKESASYIGKGNFYFNPSGYPKDEIGDLAAAFFDMALDLKKAQEELVKSKRLAAIGEVVASVNHEINNPLMIISGNAQFLEMSMENYPQDIKERVRTILEETERISQVTRKLREIRNPVVEDYTSSGEQMINLDKSSGEA
ncbi:MAG: HAMP domain-containing protein [Chitinivibrionales bacterium]|nr:HAMP domain-containing protein [Chitinivibrionales bacterium]